MPAPRTETLEISLETLSLLRQLNLTEWEYQRIVSHLGRAPNRTELAMFSVLWSEHCCYKNSRHLLRKFPNRSPRVVAGPGENAGVVDVGDGIQVGFKIESHNHPTAVEPYQGATTGVGGILRDIFTMNARPVANLNSLRFGPIHGESETVARNRFLFTRAVKGIGDYGNCVGVPTIGGEVFFDESYSGNPLVNAMAIGVIYDGAITSSKAHGVGNPILYVGNATGRDGMGGAAFASKELDEKSNDDRPAVQVGDPFSEKLLIEACLEAFATGCVVAAQDMGAAGLTSSSCEMAAKGGVGMRMDLDRVPAREPDMEAVEYLLSESQERMLFVLEKGREQPVLEIFQKWGLAAAIIGEVIGSDPKTRKPHIEIYRHGEKVVDLPAELLTDLAPDYDPKVTPEEPAEARARRTRDVYRTPAGEALADIAPGEIGAWLTRLLTSDNLASPRSVFGQYDRHVQNATVLASENLSAGVIRLRDRAGNFVNKALAATTDCNARYVYLHPERGAASAVFESARNLACVGAEPIAVTDNLNFGNPEKAEIYHQLYGAVEGISAACRTLSIPVVSGNVSLYNEFRGQAILPAPVIGTVGLVEWTGERLPVVTPRLDRPGLKVALVGRFEPSLGGSEYQKLRTGESYGEPPSLSFEDEARLPGVVRGWVRDGVIACAQDVSMGGLLPTLAECLLNDNGAGGVSLDVDESALRSLAENARLDVLLFGESNGSYLVAYAPGDEARLRAALGPQDVFAVLGQTAAADKPALSVLGETIDLTALSALWAGVLGQPQAGE